MSRSVLVTGANRGIGLAVARAFAAAGDRVTATYRTVPPPDGLFGVRCDVTDTEAVHRAFLAAEHRHGPVEVVVANAGVTADRLLPRMTEDDFTGVVDTNLTAAFRVARRAAPAMISARRGRLVFVSSAVAMAGEAGQVNYAAAKSGLIGLTRSLTRELAKYGITANVVAPGYTETEMTAAVDERLRAAWCDRIPLGRPATPAEIAAVVVFVAGMGYLNGAVIPVDGGAAMGH